VWMILEDEALNKKLSIIRSSFPRMILRISRFALLVFNWYFHLSLVLKDLIIFGITDASNVYIRESILATI